MTCVQCGQPIASTGLFRFEHRDPADHAAVPKECDNCNGYGSSLKEDSDRCSKCGGTGLER